MNRADIRQAILENADMVGSRFVTSLELNNTINGSVRDLYAVLVRAFGDERFAKSEWINVGPNVGRGVVQHDPTVAWPKLGAALQPTSYGGFMLSNLLTPDGGTISKFTLPDDFLRLLRVHFVPGEVQKLDYVETPAGYQVSPEWRLVRATQDQDFVPIRPFDLASDRISTKPARWSPEHVKYRIHCGPHRVIWGFDNSTGTIVGEPSQMVPNTAIDFLPVPDEQYAVQLFYVPKPWLFKNDVEQLPYDYPEWIIHDVAAYCLDKQRSDSSAQKMLLERIRNQIETEHQTPDAGSPPMIHEMVDPDHVGGAPWWQQ